MIISPALLVLTVVAFWSLRTVDPPATTVGAALPGALPGAGAPPGVIDGADSHTDGSNDQGPAPLNLAAFDVTLWHTPPEVETPVDKDDSTSKKRKAPPLNAVLIGIVHEDEIDQAALYDTAHDATLILSIGDEVNGWRIASITPLTVKFKHGVHTHTLKLDHPPRSWPPEASPP